MRWWSVLLVLALAGCIQLPLPHAPEAPAGADIAQRWEAFAGDTDGQAALEVTPVENATWIPFEEDARVWRTISAPPSPRFAAGSAAIGDHLYVFGGHDKRAPSDEILRLDPVAGAWQVMEARLPSARVLATAVADGERYIYVFGGRTQLSGYGGYLDEVLRYDTWTDRMDVMGAVLPNPTLDLAGGLLGDAIFLAADGRCVDCRVLRYDIDGDVVERTTAASPSLNYPAATSDGRYLYWFGGAWLEDRITLAGIYRYDPVADLVERLDHDLPHPIYSATALHDGKTIYIFGGRDVVAGGDAAVRDTVMSFDPETLRIAVAPTTLPDPSSAMTGAWMDSGGVLVSGDELGHRGRAGMGTYCFMC